MLELLGALGCLGLIVNMGWLIRTKPAREARRAAHMAAELAAEALEEAHAEMERQDRKRVARLEAEQSPRVKFPVRVDVPSETRVSVPFPKRQAHADKAERHAQSKARVTFS